MPKFNKGDRVERINCDLDEVCVGDVNVVSACTVSSVRLVGKNGYFDPDYFRLFIATPAVRVEREASTVPPIKRVVAGKSNQIVATVGPDRFGDVRFEVFGCLAHIDKADIPAFTDAVLELAGQA